MLPNRLSQIAKFRKPCRAPIIAPSRTRRELIVVSTSRHRPHRAEASERRPASPSGTAREQPGRPGPQEEPERGRRRIPGNRVSDVAFRSALGLPYQSLVADEFPGEPEEGLLEVVVRLGGDVVVLEVLLAVEGDGLGLDLALLNVDLVTGQDDGDVLADTDEITCVVSKKLRSFSAMTYGASWGRFCM